jgi:hypothetical protein
MIRFFRRLFLFSLLFCLGTIFYTRWHNSNLDNLRNKLAYSVLFPLERNEDVQIQLGVLSQKKVSELFKINSDDFQGCHLGTTLDILDTKPLNKDYIAIRFKNTYGRVKWGDIKCYFSCFSHPLIEHIYGRAKMTEYDNIILPYPAQQGDSQKPCEVSIKWKNSWGF